MTETHSDVLKEASKLKIKELVEKCEKLEASGTVGKYNEDRTRTELIDLLFAALGWDVYNKQNEDEVDRQVSVKSRGSTKKVDYAFRLGGVTKFFVEAKGLREDLEDIDFAKQAIGYGFNRSIRYAVLTNFQKLKVFNCEWNEPNLVRNLVLELNFRQFLTSDFDKLWYISKESFKTNALNDYAKTIGKRTPSKGVADLLLEQMTAWRAKLSSDLSGRYKSKYPDYEIDEAVQRLLNRLIFMRHCEDRGIEEEQLMAYLRQYESSGKSVWGKLKRLFAEYNDNYDSSLFASALIDQMEIDDALIAGLIRGIYYTPDGNKRYDFAAIPADILGNMYEQYLSHLLRKTPVRAKLEEKHAHRKEQGIYYTPTYIVDYIVKNTLGEMLKGKKLSDAPKIKILDPACGSGSFLIKAFDYMENYYKKNDPNYAQSQLYASSDNGRVTLQGKILRDNIFGVDLDQKAMEFAQLNLLLKAAETKARLPMLDENIQNGNSLIDDSTVSDKAFKWEERFKEIMDSGGFDVVIGNPPWSSKISLDETKYAAKTLGLDSKNINICAIFVQKSLELLKAGGIFGLLLPKVVIKNDSYSQVRDKLVQHSILQIVDFGQFPGVASDSVAIVVKKNARSSTTHISKYANENKIYERHEKQVEIVQLPNYVFAIDATAETNSILSKMRHNSRPLYSVCKIKRGIELGQRSNLAQCSKCGAWLEADKKYYSKESKRCKFCNSAINLYKQLCISSNEKSGKYLQIAVSGTQLKRYAIKDSYFIIPNLKGVVYKREAFSGPKIFIKRINSRIEGTFVPSEILAFNTVYSIYGLSSEGLKSITAILNSKLMHFYYEITYNVGMHLTTQVTIETLKNIPLPVAIPEKDICFLTDKILSLNKRLVDLGDKKSSERQRLEKEIQETDKKIDKLVYELYGLTNEEIKLVEDSFKK